MGFMDKAKKFADQAQSKLDDVQKQFNESQDQQRQPSAGGPAVEYDEHGRPLASDPSPPHGDPLSTSAAPATPAPEAAAAPAPTDGETPQGDPLRDASPKPPVPPSGGGMTSGDPLAG